MTKNLILLALVTLLTQTESAKILGAVFTPSYSHQVAFQPIWRELSLRGHQLTVLTTNPIGDPALSNLTEIDLSMSYDIMKSYDTDRLLSTNQESFVVRMRQYMEALHVTADAQLSHSEVQDLIRNHKNDFDLLMVEVIYPTQMALSWWFEVPFIGMVSLDAPSRIHTAIGNPINPVLYPQYDLPFDERLTFSERVASTLFTLFMGWYGEFRLHSREDATIRKHFGENSPPLSILQTNMSLLFLNINPLFNKRPLVPATIPIGGGLHIKEPTELSLEVQEFLDASNVGFLYFSLGTNVKSSALHEDVKSAILQAFSELPYRVLWKFEEKVINLPKNIKVVEWVSSQTAVLAHRNIKAFITQCGLQSVEEAIFYKVPMIGLPFYGDQGRNAKIVETKGLGIKLNPLDISKDNLKQAIIKVTSDDVFKTNLEEVADLYNDQQVSGLERAIWWTEYVLRHKGAKHLRSAAIDVPFYQYMLLDIAAFVLLILVGLVCSGKLLLKMIRSAARKTKSD